MPHYADGTEAVVGDRVRGCGYNAKARGYDPEVGIDGVIVEVRPGDRRDGACTLTVAFVQGVVPEPIEFGGAANIVTVCNQPVRIGVEYGDTLCFFKV